MQLGENYVNNEENQEEMEFEEPYFFSPSITKTRVVGGKNYIVRSYFIGGKDFVNTVKNLAIKQAYNNAR